MKRLLLILDDPLLARFWREKLEAFGFEVEVALDPASASAAPDLILIDLLLCKSDGLALLQETRGRQSYLPILVFGNTPPDLTYLATDAGATTVLPATTDPLPQLVSTIHMALGIDMPKALPPGAFEVEQWVAPVLEEAAELFATMRTSLLGLPKPDREHKSYEELLHHIHALSERLLAAGLVPIYLLTSSLEALVYELFKLPSAANPSTGRTVTQAIDLLSTLVDKKTLPKLRDPSRSQVFIVDDDENTCKIVSTALSMVHLKADFAQTPTVALATLANTPADLILLDIGLPEMSGFEVCARVRAMTLHQETPIVFLSGMATFQNRVQGSLSGGNDFIAKPFNLFELGVKAMIWIFKRQLESL